MEDRETSETQISLEGQLLIAMPGLTDDLFARSVVYLCAHSEEGAMGLIINKPVEGLTFGELLEQINDHETDCDDDSTDGAGCLTAQNDRIGDCPVLSGGPVETSRGFVLHSPDFQIDGSTMEVGFGICLTATLDILKAMARGDGPDQSLLMLGYSGWAPGQLEDELRANGWLNCPASAELVLATDNADKYGKAFSMMGIDPSHLVNGSGRA